VVEETVVEKKERRLNGTTHNRSSLVRISQSERTSMKKGFTVGRVNGQPLTPKEAQLNRPVKRRRFKSQKDAENFIEYLSTLVPKEVKDGKFYLDAPGDPI
jgi:hypothetical protein